MKELALAGTAIAPEAAARAQHTPLSKLLALPRDGKAVTAWMDRDEALADVAEGLSSTQHIAANKKKARCLAGLNPILLRELEETGPLCCGARKNAN